jgi:integrase
VFAVKQNLVCSWRAILRVFGLLLALFGLRPVLFAEVAILELKEKQLKAEETRKSATRQINRLIRNFGAMPVKKILEEHWIDYIVRERARRERTFFDDRKYMRLVLGRAVRMRAAPRVIELTIPDLPAETGRALKPWELKAIREAARADTPDAQGRLPDRGQKSKDIGFIIDIAWKMGLRKKEIRLLRWDWIDLNAETIRLPAKFRKNRRALEIPINPDLVPEFRRRRAKAACHFVFEGKTPGRATRSIKTAWSRVLRDAGVSCRFHDLRHHCATVMALGGAPQHVVKEMLGHSDAVLKRIYLHLDMPEMRKAAHLTTDAVGDHAPSTIEQLRAAARLLCDAVEAQQLG